MPTAITGTYGLVKYQTLSLKLTMNDTTCTVSNTDLLTTSGLFALSANNPVAAGPLKTFLSTIRADAAAAETAWRAIGGQINVRQVSGTATDEILVQWTATAAAPSLTLIGVGADQVLEMTITAPHSIVQ